MNVTYTGKPDNLHDKQKAQLDVKLDKISKLLDVDGKSQKRVHVILAHDKNMHRAEITLNYMDQTLVGEHIDPDQFTAMSLAIEKLEKQMGKLRDKRRDVKKGPREGWDKEASANTINQAESRSPEPLPPANNGKPRVFRVQPSDNKPLTLEEAMMVIDDEPYMVYHDARSNRLSVLVRRADGHFDLVEC
jgi:putative sigma-54 modulation protein